MYIILMGNLYIVHCMKFSFLDFVGFNDSMLSPPKKLLIQYRAQPGATLCCYLPITNTAHQTILYRDTMTQLVRNSLNRRNKQTG